jgi:membrane fusion protein (multidrug efflux system)
MFEVPMFRVRAPSLLAVALAASLALACGGGPKAGPDDEAAAEKAVVGDLDIVEVATGTVSSGPRISGTLEALDQAVIRSETGGSVTEIAAEVGQPVEKGALLARVESDVAGQTAASAQFGVTAAEQDLEVTERELARTKRLAEAGAVAPSAVERAETAVLAARARLATARSQVASAGEQVEATGLRSPIAGVVSQRSINVGDVLSPGTPMFTVIDPKRLRLEGAVPADAVGQLQLGSTVQFSVQGYDGRSFAGTVESIAPAVDPVTRQIPVIVSLPNPEGVLMAGLFAEGRVAAEQRQGFVVPIDAVEESGGRASVLRVREGVVERVEVSLGLRDDDAEQVELTGGVTAGDVVLVGAAREIKPGTPVEIRRNGTKG